MAETLPTPPPHPPPFAPPTGMPRVNVPLAPPIKLVDPQGTYTGHYPRETIQAIVRSAKLNGMDPHTALAVALQESGFGTAQGAWHDNPMTYHGPSGINQATAQAVTPPGATRMETMFPPRESMASNVYRDSRTDAAMMYLKQRMQEQAQQGQPEERQIQAYNGLGRPSALSKDPDQRFYGVKASELPPNFYGHRVIHLRENVIKASPEIQGIIAQEYGQQP